MNYKQIAITLCNEFLDMPFGCEECPLYDKDGICDLKKLLSEDEEE